ncbi:hypothetical protein IEE94_11445 [Yimella sp. cx-573]|nr:hypothetical protein [Yimella sp. cx-573]
MPDLFNPATDPGAFAEQLLGRPLWPHQLEFARSDARYRVVCAGRQAGKSAALAVMALHTAYTRRNALVLLVSAGEAASRRLLEDCASLALASPLLRGSVLDESKSELVLSNGSRILSVPASQRQIRGWPVSLLVIDEAGFVDPEIWRAAEPSVIAQPGSRVILTSSPWGGPDHFFRQLWHRGIAAPDDQVASWHWPSRVSPLVDAALLEQIRGREPADYYAREYEAQWTDTAGSYFSEAELSAAATVAELVQPSGASGLGAVVGGVDWGFARDANALTVLAAREDLDERGRVRFWVPYLREAFATPYDAWIDELTDTARGYRFSRLVCEQNGVGAMPSQVLAKAFLTAGLPDVVEPVTTTVSLKETAFGWARVLLAQRRLELPNDPSLLRQLRGLEFEQLASGGVKIAVPERVGHDDVAMSLCLALHGALAADVAPAPVAEVFTAEDLGLDLELGWEMHA